MKNPEIPKIEGIEKMSPLEMNGVHFDKRHTVLTPELLATLKNTEQTGRNTDQTGTAPSE